MSDNEITSFTLTINRNRGRWEWHVVGAFDIEDQCSVQHAQGVAPTPVLAVEAATWWLRP